MPWLVVGQDSGAGPYALVDWTTWVQDVKGTRTWSVASFAPERREWFVAGSEGVYGVFDGEDWRVFYVGSVSAPDYRDAAWSPKLGTWLVTQGAFVLTYDGASFKNTSPPAGTWSGVAWSDTLEKWLVVGDSGIWGLFDGTSWTSGTQGSGIWQKAAWSDTLEKWLVVGSSGIWGLFDGTSWTSGTQGTSHWTGVAWSDTLEKWLVVASNAYRLFDGTTWAGDTRPSMAGSARTAWSPQLNAWGVTGNKGKFLVFDGTTWTEKSSGNNEIWRAVAWGSLNTPPGAPDQLTPDSEVLNVGLPQTFSWRFNDPDDGDLQSEYELRYQVVGAGSWTIVGDETVVTHHTFPASTFTVGETFEWQVRTWDQSGEVSPWSDSAFFDTAAQPSAPVIVSPANNATVADPMVLVEWSANTQTAYQIRRVADDNGNPNPGSVLWDSGQVNQPVARDRQVEFPVNNTVEHIQVRRLKDGLWSTWASIRIMVAFTEPLAPFVTVAAHGSGAAITVAVVHPPPSSEPLVVAQEVWRRQVGDTRPGVRVAFGVAGVPFIDWAVASGVDYEYRVKAVAETGTTAWSGWDDGQ